MTTKSGKMDETATPLCEPPAEKQKRAEAISMQNQTAAMHRLMTVKKHDATSLHYDLRLSYNRRLLSWAVPDGPSYCPSHQREAIQVEDHDPEYAYSEHVIHEGPGTGTVMQWDWGTWVPLPGYTDVNTCLRNGLLRFTLFGEKLKGNWTLARVESHTRTRPNAVWTLTKEQDSFARNEAASNIVDEAPNSVSTGRTMKEIAEAPNKSKCKDKHQRKLFDE